MPTDIFDPITINGLELSNRFMRSATWDATADETGAVSDTSLVLYNRLGDGDIGLVVSGYAFVSDHGQAVVGQYGVYTDEMIPGLRRMAQAVHDGGGKIALQIVHAGINSGFLSARGVEPMAMSCIPEVERPHHEFTQTKEHN